MAGETCGLHWEITNLKTGLEGSSDEFATGISTEERWFSNSYKVANLAAALEDSHKSLKLVNEWLWDVNTRIAAINRCTKKLQEKLISTEKCAQKGQILWGKKEN